ncbi:MAG TPA: tetratricopeptide repeat protein, partial [Polyangiaceae bacterium]|nr:tetratricopeptide repeat protein [Polyangiaceae bacterium]
RDHFALAGLARKEGDYDQAVALIKLASEAAGRSSDSSLDAYLQVARGDVLWNGGDFVEAETVLERALRHTHEPATLAWAHLTLGLVYLESERDVYAEKSLQRALDLATPLAQARVVDAARLNLAWLARRAGRFDEAEEVFASFGESSERGQLAFNRGLVAADRGDLERAADFLLKAEKSEMTGNWAWPVAYERGVVAERRGRLDEARASYRRAIDTIDELRARSGSMAAHVLAAHRLPHERLVALAAREGRWHDVLSVVLSLDLSMVLATDPTPRDVQLDGKPTHADGASVRRLKPQFFDVELGGKGTHEASEVERTLNAWRGRRLVVLVPGGDRRDPARGRLWRLEVVDGEVKGVDAGPLERLEQLARTLEATPDDRVAARALGEALIPPSPPGEPVDVLALGPIARAPLGALRHGDALVTASTPLARVLGLRPWTKPRVAAKGRRVVVLGDPLGNLPSAAREAAIVAEGLNAPALLGFEATQDALASARGASLLHVASHATEGADGTALLLADGPLTAPAVNALGATARLVVLSSCASAASRDGSGWGSLAAA